MNLLLSSKNIPIDTVFDENGNNLLSIACQNGNKKVVKFILRQQQQQQAAINGNDSRILLVNYMNGSNLNGNTALHFSFKYGFGDTLGEYLISKGADRSIRNKDGLTCDDLSAF
jgi:ankyrin repeat protein